MLGYRKRGLPVRIIRGFLVTQFQMVQIIRRREFALSWAAPMLTAAGFVSKIAGDQVVGTPAPANVEPGSGGTYQVTVGIESVEKTRFIGTSIWLNAPQCVFVYKKRRFHRAIVSPKPHSMPRSVI